MKVIEILKSVQMAIEKKEVGPNDKEVVEFRDQLKEVQSLALEVFLFTMMNNKVALFPWSFTPIKEFGALTNEQIDAVLTACPSKKYHSTRLSIFGMEV